MVDAFDDHLVSLSMAFQVQGQAQGRGRPGRSNSDSSTATAGVMTTPYSARQRKRTAHACDACRLRKSRCDGRQPCSWCTENEVDCLYGKQQPSITQGKSDQILEAVLRMDGLLRSIHENLNDPHNTRTIASPRFSDPSSPDNQDFAKVANATIPSTHISATQDLLSGPFAAPFPSLRAQFRPIFLLESSCPPIRLQSRSIRPVFTTEEAERLLTSFQRHVNFWYPTISKTTLQMVFERVRNNFSENLCEDCIALLVMALGAASELIQTVYGQGESGGGFEERRLQSELLTMASVCFDEAMELLTVAYMEVSTVATQCVFLAALYCSFLQRPLQTWGHLNTAAAKCRSLIAYGTGSANPEDDECIRRIFWSCYIIESDLISELSHLPQSGVADHESHVPLPGPLQTHFSDSETESSALYFLSCISIRRLLNRVHHLLYSTDQPSSHQTQHALSPQQNLHQNQPQPSPNFQTHNQSQNRAQSRDKNKDDLIAELSHQLTLWHTTLPTFLQFPLNSTKECDNEYAAFLRQRYLACTSVIFRPYVEILLHEVSSSDFGGSGLGGGGIGGSRGSIGDRGNGGEGGEREREVLEGAMRCLDASCDHIFHLRSFGQTVLVDTWICGLSMTSTMFILLASLRHASLRPLILQNHQIHEFGPHLRGLLNSWIGLHSTGSTGHSPSLVQCVDLIGCIEGLMTGLLPG